jgi:hypothetical protein
MSVHRVPDIAMAPAKIGNLTDADIDRAAVWRHRRLAALRPLFCLSFAMLSVFLGRNYFSDSTRRETWLSLEGPRLADRTFSNQSILSQVGRSAQMPAALSGIRCAAAT